MTVKVPVAPAGLSARAKKLWRDVLTVYELSAAEVELLRNALLALDTADAAATIVKREGVTVRDRYGSPKAHPATDVEARNRALFGRFVAQLGVKLAPGVAPPRRGAKPGPRPRVAPSRAVR
jgi:hypothetical protein